MVDTIWNSTKFDADERPDWVKAIMASHKVSAYFERDIDRWYFSPIPRKEELEVGHTTWLLMETGIKIPSVWDGEKYLNMRTPEGKKFYDETRRPGLRN